jgi:hypothetical protein
LRGARSAWARLNNDRPWSRSCVPDYPAGHAANDGANGAPDDRTRDRAADDSGHGSITVGQGELRRGDKGHGCDEKECFLMHDLSYWA